jgi:hypothetical protein
LHEKTLFGYFETFRAFPIEGVVKKNFDLVTLVWAPREVPIEEAMASVEQQIAQRDGGRDETKIHVLHHGSSEDLAKYVAKLEQRSHRNEISFLQATISPKFLRADEKVMPASLRPITTDDFLIDALVQELSLRIPALNSQTKLLPRIVVFTESDTNYGRAITSELQEKFAGKAYVAVYSYLRGLDGRAESASAPAETETMKKSDSVGSILQTRAISETSLGTSQFDYLRRLAFLLESEMRTKAGHAVVAVGIMGSDIYDKMLVLQAVRPELSSALVFTTDLDALYLERENQPFTRNLIVASADSLDANPESPVKGNWKLPPMRDSYQTVLVKQMHDLLSDKPLIKAPKPARVFEIAPGKSVELPLPSGDSFKTRGAKFVLRELPGLSGVVFLLALFNAFIVLIAIATRKFCEDANEPERVAAPMNPWARALVFAEVVVAFLGILFLLYQFIGDRPVLFGEPLALGISIWPSVMIRLLAFLVALVLLLTASYSFVASGTPNKKILQKALPNTIDLPLAEGLLEESVRFCRSVISEKPIPPAEQTFNRHLDKLFDQKRRPKRIMVASLVYLLLSLLLFWIWQPSVPGRGAFPLLTEKIVLSLGVSLYIIHLLFCLDLHLCAFTLLRALRSFYAPAVQRKIKPGEIKTKLMLSATSHLTSIIGKTLLYPLTVLILIILSRLRIFDNWVMTPSLTITFALGAALLVAASLTLWIEGSRLKRVVLAHYDATQADPAMAKEREELCAINEGVFAAWYNQPIFSAILSAAAVFGSLSIAGPLAGLLFGYS